jgi:carbon monoxide dehydrogenase subunit G
LAGPETLEKRDGFGFFDPTGTERRIVRLQDAAQQTECYSGKKKDHTVQNVLLINAPLTILFLSATYGGRIHDKRMPRPPRIPYVPGAGSCRIWVSWRLHSPT